MVPSKVSAVGNGGRFLGQYYQSGALVSDTGHERNHREEKKKNKTHKVISSLFLNTSSRLFHSFVIALHIGISCSPIFLFCPKYLSLIPEMQNLHHSFGVIVTLVLRTLL